ncbi:cysteine desulfurase [Candidatus Saccharibacteria bacterium]|nr:cysteine desulfurase [Candidatus Saccharibacteria bacterium]
MIYLDHAAATPLAPNVLAAMKPFLSDAYFNASAPYLAAKSVAKAIEAARATVAKSLGCRPTEIIFVAGGTEANNLAVHGVLQAFPEANILTSGIEHDSVLAPAMSYQNQRAKTLPSGVIDVADLKQRINDKTVMISVMYANNEIGTIQPLAEIAKLVKEIKQSRAQKGNKLPLYFHTDACQAGNYLHISVDKLGVDMMTLNAGKLYGPKQTGALYVKTGTKLNAQILGGGQERNMRSGTENAANIAGFAAALGSAHSMRSAERKRMADLRKTFVSLLTQKVPQAVLTTTYKYILPNNIHLVIPGYDNERLMMSLDEAGIMCAIGSACSASNDQPSHVLKAVGLSDAEAQSSLRFSMGRSTSQEEIERTIAILAKLAT